MSRLIDSHCHLDYEYDGKSAADLVREATLAGVSHLITIGTEEANLTRVRAISEQFENVFFTVGVHPHEAKDVTSSTLTHLRAAASHPKCKAIGEIGLDYHYDHSPRDIQKEKLIQQLTVALEVKKPVVIHARDAEPDMLEIFAKHYIPRVPKGSCPGVIHCFTGTKAFALRCIEMGFYISFSGVITFKKSDDLRETAKELPLDRLLVETDSPYLAPVPFRGKKCEPSMIKVTAEKLAEIKGISFEEVANATFKNTSMVFNLGL